MAYVERALDLPARTVARWKSGEHSASALALLRVVATYPWMLEVAEHRFDLSVADAKVVMAAGKVFAKFVNSNHVNCDVHVTSDGDSATLNAIRREWAEASDAGEVSHVDVPALVAEIERQRARLPTAGQVSEGLERQWVAAAGAMDQMRGERDRAREEAAAWKALAKALAAAGGGIWTRSATLLVIEAKAKLRSHGIDPDAPEPEET